jgi:hypothetical protein
MEAVIGHRWAANVPTNTCDPTHMSFHHRLIEPHAWKTFQSHIPHESCAPDAVRNRSTSKAGYMVRASAVEARGGDRGLSSGLEP